MSPPDSDPLSPFHPIVRAWFEASFPEPTDVQRRTWPPIASGEHVLATAPTGSGKTLAAFLWGLDRLLSGAWAGGRVRMLYVSPLKALNNDVERNLLGPLAELVVAFEAAGEPVQGVRVATRSGDTPSHERQRMVRRPPEVLITTPESLNLLLTSDGGRSMLTGLEAVILDEVHAVAGSKRGTHLMTGVERLTRLSGEFQRIALSATVRPLETVARWIGGHQLSRRGREASFRPRPVRVVEGTTEKRYRVEVRFPVDLSEGRSQTPVAPPRDPATPPQELDAAVDPELLWSRLTTEIKQIIRRRRSTLVFANSRRLAEKVTRLLNDDETRDLAYSHHGSLAREIRAVVEERFKAGELPSIVATNSLELGIDIGDLDEVVLVKTPPSVASAVQRIGRAGHAVGAVSEGTFYPLFGRDLLVATVVARAVLEQAIEPMRPVRGALDVLAQVLLSMVAAESWVVDELYDEIRTCDAYRELPRGHFDLVLEMLAGRYAATRVRELTPRIAWDRLDNRVSGRRGARRILYTSGGTIPDRGYFHLRVHGSMAKIGELDEEFVWERSINDRFVLGTQTWRIVQVTHNDVLVAPAHGSGGMAPFWRGEPQDRSFHLADRIGEFLEWCDSHLQRRGRDGEALPELLARDYPLGIDTAGAVVRQLEAQRAATGASLPHRHHLLVERVQDPQKPGAECTVVLHTTWGGRVNRAYAMALAVAWEQRFETAVDIVHDDDALMLSAAHEVDTDELLALVAPHRIEDLLRARLERTGFFGARFRENAGRALLLPRGDFKRRVPLWLNRQRSKQLLAEVGRYRDFPIVLETWRTCLQDELDLESLGRTLQELEEGKIRVSECVTSTPSPFASGLSWNLTNRLMYEDDAPETSSGSLHATLLRELVHSSLRPRLADELVATFQSKLHRTFPGYAPHPDELVEWVKERVALPLDEWDSLLAAVLRDWPPSPESAGDPEAELLGRLSGAPDLALVAPDGGAPTLVTAVETLPRLAAALGRGLADMTFTSPGAAEDPGFGDRVRARLASPAPIPTPAADEEHDPRRRRSDLLAEWLTFYGPVAREQPAAVFRFQEAQLTQALEDLIDEERLVLDQIRAGSQVSEVCDVENLERLLRLTRAAARPHLVAQPADRLPLFLAVHQGVAPRGEGMSGLQRALERLFAYPAPAALWESDLLPARLDPYHPAWLDSLMQETDLIWQGCGEQRLTFLFRSDREILGLEGAPSPELEAQGAELFGEGRGHLSLTELADLTGRSTGELHDRLWALAWQGRVTNDALGAVRQGLLSGFVASELGPQAVGSRRRPRRHSDRWRQSRSFVGLWSRLPSGFETEEPDALDREEIHRERIRLLLDRYGVLFRELLLRELPELQWSALFRSLRRMELSGEVVGGHFFEGIPGLQLASPAAVRRLREGLPEDLVYWVGALDPASVCGLPLDAFRGELPRRLPGNQVVYHGARPVLVSERGGRRLTIRVPPDHPDLGDYLEPLRVRLTRTVGPERYVEVETINGEPARTSEYAPALASRFQVSSGARSLRLWRRYA